MILHDLIDYDTLRLIWWVLLGVLLIGFAATDGFDMGVATLMPFIGKTDLERRVVINTIGPVWEGNQVWFILGGGAIFAAWPPLYAVSFSGFYLAMFVVLAALILRPVGFKYRSKRDDPKWRARWDWALFVGGAVPPVIFGVAVGNVLQGAPFHLTEELRSLYEGNFFQLLDPFSLLCGLTSLALIVMHGGAWLGLKAEGVVAQRGRAIGAVAALIFMALFTLCGLLLATLIDGYSLVTQPATDGPSNPLLTEVARGGSWLSAYAERPWIVIAPALGYAGAALTFLGLALVSPSTSDEPSTPQQTEVESGGQSRLSAYTERPWVPLAPVLASLRLQGRSEGFLGRQVRREGLILITSFLAVFGTISTVGLTMFPFILPSTIDPRSSLTVWDASSSHTTLFIMLGATVIFLPIILLYTAWVYRILWGKVSEETVKAESHSVY